MKMKKTLLSIGLGIATMAAQAQIVTYVLAPAELEGPLEFTWADNWGQTPDLNDPANQITGTAVFVDDGSGETGQQGCAALVNGAEIAGNIAVVYRGTCEFGLKAWNAQQAGAIGVVIVNNVPGVIAMGGGTNGPDVTIPVVMIGSVEGALLAPEIAAGNVELLIGSVLGVYEYNLHTNVGRVDMPTHTALPSALINDGSFQVPIGTWVRNFGSEAQSDVSLNVTITDGSGEVYNETSAPASLAHNQEMFFSLPPFAPAMFNGGYTITYTAVSGAEDDFPADNSAALTFLANDLMGYGRVDLDNENIIPDEHYRATDGLEDFMVCSYFRHSNASALQVHGLWTSLAMGGGASVEGEYLEAHIYEWNDPDGMWPDVTFDSVELVEIADYEFTENLAATPVYIQFATPYTMADDQKYLFCSKALGDAVYLGMGNVVDYAGVQAVTGEPIYTIGYSTGAGISWGYFGDLENGYSCIGVDMKMPVSVPENDMVQTTPFPNPATDLISIPLNGYSGAASLQVFDLAGNKVDESRVSVAGELLRMDVGSFSNGVYIFQMNFDNGQRSTFRVAVTK